MVGVCSQCGLPQDLCVCETIAREQQKITVGVEKRKFGKKYTIISGIGKEANVEEILKKLKTRLACGGTAKSGDVELQGDHKFRAREILMELGFRGEAIEVR